jgi:hypothetical protein
VPAFVDPAESRSPIQRRSRVSRAFVGGDEWLKVEVQARQSTSERNCPNEAFASRMWTRQGTAAWSEVRGVGGDLLGIFHDNGRVIAIVTTEVSGDDNTLCRGGSGCELLTVYRRAPDGAFTRAQRLPYQVRGGNPIYRRSILQQADRMCGAG